MRRTFLLLAFWMLAVVSEAIGSTPRGDDLTVGDKTIEAHGFTLSEKLLESAAREVEELQKAGEFGYTRTNPDGIIVDLELKSDRLYVTAISISSGKGDYALHPRKHRTQLIKEPLLADWFSGKISFYTGIPIFYHIKEKGYHLTFKEGVLNGTVLRALIDGKEHEKPGEMW